MWKIFFFNIGPWEKCVYNFKIIDLLILEKISFKIQRSKFIGLWKKFFRNSNSKLSLKIHDCWSVDSWKMSLNINDRSLKNNPVGPGKFVFNNPWLLVCWSLSLEFHVYWPFGPGKKMFLKIHDHWTVGPHDYWPFGPGKNVFKNLRLL